MDNLENQEEEKIVENKVKYDEEIDNYLNLDADSDEIS